MRWEDIFELKYDTETGGMDMHTVNAKFVLIEKASGKVVGAYDDQMYAIKQARHKFKRYMKRIERMLLG